MSDLPDLREQITDLFRDGYLYRESPKAIADRVLAVVEPVEASRRDWAAEALRLQVVLDAVYDGAKSQTWGSASVHPEGGGS